MAIFGLIAGSIISGLAGASASRKAADAASAASKYAADLQNDQFLQTREDMMPWLDAGKIGLNALTQMAGKGATPEQLDKWRGKLNALRPDIKRFNRLNDRYDRVQGKLDGLPGTVTTEPQPQNPGDVRSGTVPTGSPVTEANPEAGRYEDRLAKIKGKLGDLGDPIENALALKTKIAVGKNSPPAPRDPYDTASDPLAAPVRKVEKWKDSKFHKDKPRDPYDTASDPLVGPERVTPSWEDSELYRERPGNVFEESPDYQFRLAEGAKALERSGNAAGLTYSGNMAKALMDYGQNTAAAEYDNWFTRNQTAMNNRDRAYLSYEDMRDRDQRWNYGQQVDSYNRGVQDQNIFDASYQNYLNNRNANQAWNYQGGLDSYYRAMDEQNNLWNRNAALSGFGQTAASNLSTTGANAATNAGKFAMLGANAQGQGYMGMANALDGTMNNLASIYGYENGLSANYAPKPNNSGWLWDA